MKFWSVSSKMSEISSELFTLYKLSKYNEFCPSFINATIVDMKLRGNVFLSVM